MTTDDIMALANKYAASNGKALLEKLYGTTRSYTEQCTAEAFQDRQALRAAIETLRYEVDAIAAIKEERDALRSENAELWADAERYRWLAKHGRSTSEHWGGRWSIAIEGPCPKSHNSEVDFDAAIDAARCKK